eukprot:scaffold295506_cov32-Tisochrysis_lutea.AAC.2
MARADRSEWRTEHAHPKPRIMRCRLLAAAHVTRDENDWHIHVEELSRGVAPCAVRRRVQE